ncbi:Fungalysin metallopeptidase-domain-containing protein [Fimicolochytrium jonesii]|uniref:Fungalysin metallopeptidase-domain-containing protein n=1 Tax=Fimicolochytrium jonesii TaxID=1396493 RepID=UPI0022FE0D01|nr:Fungalysin metallopeptidase-domain-containing protein [Fimicolochytrium jonesii]KAI8818129.1 Fungalysin metallopeptidase-domain-containing protein [Fimicolochytrium jonesii]
MLRLSSLALAATLLSATTLSSLAAPTPPSSAGLTAFRRQPTFTTLGLGDPVTASLRANDTSAGDDDTAAALKYLAEKTGVAVEQLDVVETYVGSNGVRHVYVKGVVGGVRVGNQDANVSIKDGKVLSWGSSLPTGQTLLPAKVDEPANGGVSEEDAITTAERTLGLKRTTTPTTHQYVETGEGRYEYTHTFQLRSAPDAPKLEWVEVDVSTTTGKIVSVTSWVASAKYTVANIRGAGNPETEILVKNDPARQGPSPLGWHNDGKASYTVTKGNNAYSQKEGGQPVSGGANNEYTKTYSSKQAPDSQNNVEAAVTNGFYVANAMHDLFWFYGFDEKAGNFQATNRDGGKGGDPVKVVVQGKAMTSNANFGTPPDGLEPVLTTFVFTDTQPGRDPAMETDIMIHEYGHGISTRLTGGPANSNCLASGEGAGLGEGWSDSLAMFIQRKASHTRNTDLVIGAWATNNPKGVRSYPYSTDKGRNPLMYGTLGEPGKNEAHAMGEVWATMWNEVYWNLVDKAGFYDDIYNAGLEKGNIVAMHILIDGLALQPCNPTFVAARDAVLQAEMTRYGGKYRCAVWKGFAKRGLGVSAKAGVFVNKVDVPQGC